MSIRQDKLSQVLREEAAKFVQNVANHQSLITVTNADVSKDLRRASIYISVLPHHEQDKALAFLNRHAAEFRGYVKSRLSLKRLPYFDFRLDIGEINRQSIDDSSDIE